MNLKKITALMLAGTLCISLFAGCAAGTESENQTESENSTESTEEIEFTTQFDMSQYLDENGYVKEVDFEKAVKLVDYKAMVIPKEKHTPTDADVEYQINYILSQFATESKEIKEGTVPDGATLNIDYVGSIDGVEFEGGSTGGKGTEVTIGVTQYIDDFLQQLVGKEIGSNFDIEVTFPDDYGAADLAGKDAIFNITINFMKETVLPELTDDFVKEKLSSFIEAETVEEFRTEIVKQMSQDMVNSYVYNEIVAGSKVNQLPENVFNLQADYILANHESTAQYYGLSLADYLLAAGYGDLDKYTENYKSLIEGSANELLILQAVAKAENLQVTEADITEYFGGEDYSVLEDLYGMPFIKFLIVQTKALTLLEQETPRA